MKDTFKKLVFLLMAVLMFLMAASYCLSCA